MLTDIFTNRYSTIKLWLDFEERDRRFLVQAFRIISEQLYPYWKSGEENPWSKTKWQLIHDKLSTELGLHKLSDTHYLYNTTWQGRTSQHVGTHTLDTVCQNFVCAPYSGGVSADTFMKDRISFVEIAFREFANELAVERDSLKTGHTSFKRDFNTKLDFKRIPWFQDQCDRLEDGYYRAVEELNTRLRQAGYRLNYHNGFIQKSDDELTEDSIAAPFWELLRDPKWVNVDIDMKEAVDRRDTSERDPAFYAARALESTIKIVSDLKGWTRGTENGAANYIDNLVSQANGRFIEVWEGDALKTFFSKVRNPSGHGPGSQPMPTLTEQQATWAIENSMSWIKSLIRRI